MPESGDFRSYSAAAEKIAGQDFRLNILKYGFSSLGLLLKNMKPIRRALARHPFDLVLGDETYEIMAQAGPHASSHDLSRRGSAVWSLAHSGRHRQGLRSWR